MAASVGALVATAWLLGTAGAVAAVAAPSTPHEDAEGLKLVAAPPRERRGPSCRDRAPVQAYRVAAIDVDITLNRYGVHDPEGRMYALEENVARVRRDEARNAAARAGRGEGATTLGLQGDAIQPLTMRVHPGECLRVTLRNAMTKPEPVSLHVHGAALRLVGTRIPAVAAEPRAMVPPGRILTYEWMVPSDEPEGTHVFHSHGDARLQSDHGLFGAIVVEPKGSRWLDPRTGRATRVGWDAVVVPRHGHSFREFALYYHEVGDELYTPLDAAGNNLPLVDPTSGAYKPNGRALNYRSEAFFDRLRLQQAQQGSFDESVAYSSYSFGDPATPIMRAYVGDPVKQRVIHGGGEVFHVHHVHGGSIRWRRQPRAEPTDIDKGMTKHPRLRPRASERVDSQSLGPSETFDVEDECGAGGCQGGAGDFLVHCHVAHHYFAGMWGLWRVYNTLQDGLASTDLLPRLHPLPDRKNAARAAVTSDALAPRHRAIDRQLPPRGRPDGYDASVFDWSVAGGRAVGEPEDVRVWPGYRSRAPGTRPPLLFDPRTGKLAYPFLRPHLGKRPPFAPDHGPAPFLDPDDGERAPPQPGANGPAGLCPAGTRPRTIDVRAIGVPVVQDAVHNLVDANGELYVLDADAAAVRADPTRRVPLAIRANAGEECIDVSLRSELVDNAESHGLNKVNMHIHFVQFDVQASDGVDAGFNYEQSVRPYALAGERLGAPSSSGATEVTVGSGERFRPGQVVAVGIDETGPLEQRAVAAVEGNRLVLDRPLGRAHASGAWVSTEFVRYRWYPDAQTGTAYFHDHVNALASWKHGLVGALVVEPPGSTYTDPRTGAPLTSGLFCDITTRDPLSRDVRGSFREQLLFLQDASPVGSVGRSSGSALNLRVDPLDARKGDPALRFSSAAHGDPATVTEAYVGDPVAFRTLVGGTNDVHTLHVDGHWFRPEGWSASSRPTSTAHLGISERADLVVPRAGGPQRRPGDYLVTNGRTFKMREGSWGLLRVWRPGDPAAGLRALARQGAEPAVPAPGSSVCPDGAPVRRFEIHAVTAPLPMLDGAEGKVFVRAENLRRLRAGDQAEPLVLHVTVGDCIRVHLVNETTGGVTFHAGDLAYDPATDSGVAVGNDPAQVAPARGEHDYTLYASPEVGETVALVRDWGDAVVNPGKGLYGAVVVHSRGSRVRGEGAFVDVVDGAGRGARDVTLFLQDDDAGIGTHRMPYQQHVNGIVGLNYRVAPDTPVVRAYAGDPLRLHVVAPWSEQAQVFSLEGHQWPLEPGRRGTNVLSSVQVGGLEAVTVEPVGGAGGPEHLAGDYRYGDHREPYREAGLWGVLRVRPACGDDVPGLARLAGVGADCATEDGGSAPGWQGAALFLLNAVGLAAIVVRRRWRDRNGASPAL